MMNKVDLALGFVRAYADADSDTARRFLGDSFTGTSAAGQRVGVDEVLRRRPRPDGHVAAVRFSATHVDAHGDRVHMILRLSAEEGCDTSVVADDPIFGLLGAGPAVCAVPLTVTFRADKIVGLQAGPVAP